MHAAKIKVLGFTKDTKNYQQYFKNFEFTLYTYYIKRKKLVRVFCVT